MIMAFIIAVLIAGGVYLVLQRGMVRLVLGMTLLSHGVNLIILAAGVGVWRSEPFTDRTSIADAADPLPQAFVLTAIVITMASTVIMLTMASLGRNDDTLPPKRQAQARRQAKNTDDATGDEVLDAGSPIETRGRSADRSVRGER